MKRRTPEPEFKTFMCAMTAEVASAHSATPPAAFGLLVVESELQEALDTAYDQLARGVPGEIEIPVAMPIVNARVERRLLSSPFPHSAALQAMMTMLEISGGQFVVGERTVEAFTKVAPFRQRKNAVLLVSRYQAPRLRTDLRGGRHRYVSEPISKLEPFNWGARATPGSRPMTLAAH